jgi:hypothetical protein
MTPNRLQLNGFYQRREGFELVVTPVECENHVVTIIGGDLPQYRQYVFLAKRDNHQKRQSIKAAAIAEYNQQEGDVFAWAVENGYSHLSPI